MKISVSYSAAMSDYCSATTSIVNCLHAKRDIYEVSPDPNDWEWYYEAGASYNDGDFKDMQKMLVPRGATEEDEYNIVQDCVAFNMKSLVAHLRCRQLIECRKTEAHSAMRTYVEKNKDKLTDEEIDLLYKPVEDIYDTYPKETAVSVEVFRSTVVSQVIAFRSLRVLPKLQGLTNMKDMLVRCREIGQELTEDPAYAELRKALS